MKTLYFKDFMEKYNIKKLLRTRVNNNEFIIIIHIREILISIQIKYLQIRLMEFEVQVTGYALW